MGRRVHRRGTMSMIVLKYNVMVSVCLLLFLLQNLSFAQLFQPRAIQVSGYLVGKSYGNVVALLVLAGQAGLAALFATQTHLVGRRWLLGASAVLVTVAHFTLRPTEYLVFSTWTLEKRTEPTNWRGVVSIVALVLSYSFGLCHLPPLLTGELVPLRIRYLGSAAIWATRWIVMFLMVHFDDSVLAVMQTRQVFLAFCLLYVLTACVTVALIPETEGRTLVDIAKNK